VLVSGNGTTLQALIDATADGTLASPIATVIADRPCFALDRAGAAGIRTELLPRSFVGTALSSNVDRCLREAGVSFVVLAGWLSILDAEFTEAWRGRLINTHPALLPAFGGNGMFGIHVHRAVLSAGETQSGATVHYVDAGVDTGDVIAQTEVPVVPGDTPESLQDRVQAVEKPLLIETIKRMERNAV